MSSAKLLGYKEPPERMSSSTRALVALQAAAASEPKVVVGLDFGTYASGFSYCKVSESLPGPSQMLEPPDYPCQPEPKYPKNLTVLLYNGRQPVAWGWKARTEYLAMGPEMIAPRGPYTFLQNFKLCLEPTSEGAQLHPLPHGWRVTQVVTDFLKLMKSDIIKYLRDPLRMGPGLTSDEVVWSLTVPAMWSDTAKDMMRNAAYMAGLTLSRDSDMLRVTLEPEAAALSAVHVPRTPGSGSALGFLTPIPSSSSTSGLHKQLNHGDVLVVVDVGGGTSDITLHEVIGALTDAGGIGGSANGTSGAKKQERKGFRRLSEAATGSGAFHAGVKVDAAFGELCRERFHGWEEWAKANPSDLQLFMAEWDAVKRQFEGLPSSRGAANNFSSAASTASSVAEVFHILRLPHSLIPRNRAGGATMQLDPDVIARRLFDPVVDKIIQQAQAVVRDGIARGKACNKVLLAGGFCSSKYVQRRMRAALAKNSDRVQMLIPAQPAAAVMQGAVLYGLQPSAIAARRMRAAYGVGMSSRLTTALREELEGCDWLERVFTHKEEEVEYVGDVFDRSVRRDELVDVDQVVEEMYSPMYSMSKEISFTIYKTRNNDERLITQLGMEKVAKVVLTLPDGWAESESWRLRRSYSLQATMQFGQTEIRFTAKDCQTDRKVQAAVKYSEEAKQ